MGGWICGSWMVTSMYLLFLRTSWQMWGACSLRQRQANSCACQGDSDRNKIRSVRFLDLATSYLYWPPLHLLSVHLLLCLFLMWHQAKVSSAPRSPYLPLVPPFLSCAPLSHAVHLLCCSLSWQAAIQTLRALRGTQFIFLFLSFLFDAMNTISAPCVREGWMREREAGQREEFVYLLSMSPLTLIEVSNNRLRWMCLATCMCESWDGMGVSMGCCGMTWQ